MYIYIYIYICICTCIYINIYAGMYIYVYIYMYIHIYVNTWIWICTFKYVHKCIHTHAHSHAHLDHVAGRRAPACVWNRASAHEQNKGRRGGVWTVTAVAGCKLGEWQEESGNTHHTGYARLVGASYHGKGVCSCIHTCMHACIHTFIQTCMHGLCFTCWCILGVFLHKYSMHAYIHTGMHAYIHMCYVRLFGAC